MYFGKAKKMQEKYLEEKEKRLNERSEYLDEKKQLLDRIEKCSKDDNTVKSTRWTRRNIIVGVIGGIVGIAAALVTAISTALGTWLHWREINPKADITLTSRVFSPVVKQSGIVPGGVNFALNNDGNKIAGFVNARITIEDYVRLSACVYGSFHPPEACHGVILPVDVDVNSERPIDVPLSHEAPPNGSSYFNLVFSVGGESSDATSTVFGENGLDVHIYRLHIILEQNDDSSIDAGRFVVVVPRDDLLHYLYWRPEHSTGETGEDTREKSIKSWAGISVDAYEEAMNCIVSNEKLLNRIMADGANMSPIMERIKEGIKSGRYTYPPESGQNKEDSNFECPKNS